MNEPPPATSPPAGTPKPDGVAVVVAGGDGFDPAVLAQLPAGATVIAADSGFDTARAHGLEVDLVIGDLDSVSPSGLAAAEAQGIAIERHPADKDHTDLDLALKRVAAEGFTRCIVAGGGGGRLSHLLANAALIGAERYAGLDIRWLVGSAEATVARLGRPAQVSGHPGDLVTLLATHDRATGVTTTGLHWPLVDASVEAGSTRGVSNELAEAEATVTVRSGSLLVIHEPGNKGMGS